MNTNRRDFIRMGAIAGASAALSTQAEGTPFVNGAKIDLGAAGDLDLDYSGEAVVRELWANGRQCQAGTYSATSGHSVSSRISGTGALVVLEGKARGGMVLVR